MTIKPIQIVVRILRVGVVFSLLPVVFSGATEAASWTGGGNEPGWRVEVSDTAINFVDMEGESFTIQPKPEPLRAEGIEVYLGGTGDRTVSLVSIEKICTDGMSGMAFPMAVVVTIGDRALVGCGGDPLRLLVGEWKTEEISGTPVIAGSEASLGFDLDGSIHGNTSCNRFFGDFSLTGEGLTLSPGDVTRMACSDDLMQQEQKFLSALEKVRRFEILPSGVLRLLDESGSTALALRK